MGLEARCRVHYEGQSSEGSLQWESTELRFRGDIRLDIPAKEIKKVEARGADLHVAWGKQKAIFEVGLKAPKWAEKIQNPPTLLDKLGVKSEMSVGLKGEFPPEFVEDLRARCKDLSLARARKDSDMVFLLAAAKPDLDAAPKAATNLKSTGALWIVYPKGVKAITEADVRACGKLAGLVDVKVASFSATHTALKFVVPITKR